MTAPRGPAGHAGARPRSRLAEVRVLGAIALPLIAANLAEFAMFVTTKLVVGGLGHEEFAAVGLAGELSFEILVVLMGLLSIVGVLAAQAEGADCPRDAGHAARQGFVVATVVGLPATVLVWHLGELLALAGQDPRIVALATPYLHGLAGFMLPMLWFTVLRNFVAALARTGAVMVITLSAVGLNYLLTRALVHGAGPLPALGVAGAGWATTLVSWCMLSALLLFAWRAPALRSYRLLAVLPRVDTGVCAEILRLGLPVAGLVLLEGGMFAAVAVLSGVLGTITLAAYEVLMSWIGIPFVIALGLAEATMVRVAHGVGRADALAARNAGLLGMQIGVGVLALLVVVPLSLADVIVGLFVATSDPAFTDILALTAELLVIAAIFQVFDGLQAIASRALRGLRDTIAPLWIAAAGYWVLGIGGGSALAFAGGLGGAGLWWGLALGLITTASLLALRFHWLTRKDRGRA